MVLRLSAPSAFDADPITLLASPASAHENAAHDNRVRSDSATIHFLPIIASSEKVYSTAGALESNELIALRRHPHAPATGRSMI
jgi:hypothetical protein